MVDQRGGARWTFLTNHAHVLVCIAEDEDIRGRDIAERVGITERAAQAIIADLVNEGYVERTKIGRRNRYTVNPDAPLRHPLEQDHSIGELLVTLGRLQPRKRVPQRLTLPRVRAEGPESNFVNSVAARPVGRYRVREKGSIPGARTAAVSSLRLRPGTARRSGRERPSVHGPTVPPR